MVVKLLRWLETAFTKMWMLPVFLIWMAVRGWAER